MHNSSRPTHIKKSPNPLTGSRLPPFAQWQAKQSSSRDMMFGIILLLVYFVYLYKTIPELCARGPSSRYLQQQQQNIPDGDQQQQWPNVWSLVCDNPAAAAAKLVPGWRATAALRGVVAAVQGWATFFMTGLLSGDVIHLVCGPLRLSFLILLLVPCPYPNPRVFLNPFTTSSSSRNRLICWYHPDLFWQRPALRSTAVALQRLVPPALMLMCSCVARCRVSWYAAVQKSWWWHLLGKHAFQGWVATMLALPLRAHVVVNLAEWIINYTFFSKALGPNSNSSSSTYSSRLDLFCLCVSCLFVVVIPTCGVMWQERAQRQSYQQQQQLLGIQNSTLQYSKYLTVSDASSSRSDLQMLTGTKAVVNKKHNVDPPSLLPPSSSSSSSGGQVSVDSSSISKAAEPQESGSVESKYVCVDSTCYNKTARSAIAAGGLRLACTEETNRIDSSHSSSSSSNKKNDAAGSQAAGNSSSTDSAASGSLAWLPAVRSLLGADAADVAAAAAGDALGVQCLSYQSLVTCLPVGIKVHCDHSSVSSVGPVLTSALHYQLSPFNTAAAPLAITTACFQGCVQLIAYVMGLKRNVNNAVAAAAIANGSTHASASSCPAPGNSGSSSNLFRPLSCNISSRVAAGLLDTVQQSIETWCRAAAAAAAAGGSGISPAGALEQPDVDVTVGNIAISSADDRQGAGAVSSSSSSAHLSVALQSVDPVCLVAHQGQQIRLCLRLSGRQQQQQQQPGCQDAASSGPEAAEPGSPDWHDQGSTGPPGTARLLVLREGQVLLDDSVSLTDPEIRLALPAQTPGVLHLALLPGTTPQPPAVAAATPAGDVGCSGQQASAAAPIHRSSVAGAPLLLQPLLVLPTAAVADLQRYHRHLLPAENSTADDAARAWGSVSAITVDMAYIITLCASTAAAAGGGGGGGAKKDTLSKEQMPPGVQVVMKQLLVHLAACGLWDVLSFLVKRASEVFAAADTSQESSSSSSSSGSDDMVPAVASGKQFCSCSNPDSSREATACEPDTDKTSQVSDVSKDKGGGCSSSEVDFTHTATQHTRSVTASELLWGFRDITLEVRYQVAAFTSSGFWDLISLAFTASMSLGFYFRKQSGHGDAAGLHSHYKAVQATRVASPSAETAGVSPLGAEALSEWLFALAYLCGPLPVLLLRLQVAWQLQQRQQDPTAVLIRAAAMKQQLLLFWMAVMPVLLGVFAVSDVLATPAWVVRVWSVCSRSQDIGCVFAVAIKGLTGQIPFATFWPIITAQAVTCVMGSIKYGLRPHYWLAVRYIPMVLLPTILAAWQHIQGRRAFCARQRIPIG